MKFTETKLYKDGYSYRIPYTIGSKATGAIDFIYHLFPISCGTGFIPKGDIVFTADEDGEQKLLCSQPKNTIDTAYVTIPLIEAGKETEIWLWHNKDKEPHGHCVEQWAGYNLM